MPPRWLEQFHGYSGSAEFRRPEAGNRTGMPCGTRPGPQLAAGKVFCRGKPEALYEDWRRFRAETVGADAWSHPTRP